MTIGTQKQVSGSTTQAKGISKALQNKKRDGSPPGTAKVVGMGEGGRNTCMTVWTLVTRVHGMWL